MRGAILVLIAAANVCGGWAAQAGATGPKVVFVCEHGAAKSVIAAKEMEKLARERGIAVRTATRGTSPDAEIPEYVRSGLKKDGIDVRGVKPVKVTREDLRDADVVVSFGPDLSAMAGSTRVVDWSATPDVSKDFGAARDSIVKRLQALLDQIASTKR
jgi:protein-tyrosine-phosphatase